MEQDSTKPKVTKDRINALTGIILDCSIAVHKEMGPGLPESVYEACLLKEFELRGIAAKSQVKAPLKYKGFNLNKDFILDLLIEDEIIIELKSIDSVLPVHEAQLISYLKLTDKRLGLLINFNVPLVKNGFIRYINNLD
ncbi:MAG: GxxExxY protein [Bacteroidia bacterium]